MWHMFYTILWGGESDFGTKIVIEGHLGSNKVIFKVSTVSVWEKDVTSWSLMFGGTFKCLKISWQLKIPHWIHQAYTNIARNMMPSFNSVQRGWTWSIICFDTKTSSSESGYIINTKISIVSLELYDKISNGYMINTKITIVCLEINNKFKKKKTNSKFDCPFHVSFS